MDYDALEKRLKELREDDHERGCEGRFYSCSCDYEPRIDQALKDSQVAIADLRARAADTDKAQKIRAKAIRDLKARNDALVKALEPFVTGYSHTSVFLRSRQQMHPVGQDLYAEDVERARAALAANREG